MKDDSEKREIYIMSDMHLGGEWAKETIPKLEKFAKTLARVAEQFVHTIVLLGDIFEMWMTPITIEPPSKEEMVKTWKEQEVRYELIHSVYSISLTKLILFSLLKPFHSHVLKSLSKKLFCVLASNDSCLRRASKFFCMFVHLNYFPIQISYRFHSNSHFCQTATQIFEKNSAVLSKA